VHAVTIRRLIVFAVCALGVGGLYLVPSLARSPEQLGSDLPHDQPRTRPSSRSTTPVAAAAASANPRPGRSVTAPEPPPEPPATPSETRSDQGSRPDPGPREATHPPGPRPTRVATAYDPAEKADQEPPQPVREIKTETVTADRLSLNWPPARDNVGVIGYHVWLNGFDVASTVETHVSVPWFNDDTATHVVQVRAVDAAGNASETSPSVLVTRPEPEPSSSAPPFTPPPSSPSAPPSSSPEPTEQPQPTPGPTPSDEISTEPDGLPKPTTSPISTPEPTATSKGTN